MPSLASKLILIKAFQEIAKGEQTATALENHLSALEAKIEALLAQATQNETNLDGLQEQLKAENAQIEGDKAKVTEEKHI